MELSNGTKERLPTTIVVGKLSISQTIQDELTKALKKDLGSRTLAETTKMLNKFVKDLNGNTITEDKVDAMHAFSADVRIKLREIANTEKARALTDEAVLPDDVKIVSSYAGVLSTFSTLDRGSVHELIRRDAIRRHRRPCDARTHTGSLRDAVADCVSLGTGVVPGGTSQHSRSHRRCGIKQ